MQLSFLVLKAIKLGVGKGATIGDIPADIGGTTCIPFTNNIDVATLYTLRVGSYSANTKQVDFRSEVKELFTL